MALTELTNLELHKNMRIIAGELRGRRFVDSKNVDFRPTTDRNREALFNILLCGRVVKEFGFDLIDANVLDICCGSGSIAFEALSRGAKSATLIDNNNLHLDLAKQNSQLFKIEDKCDFILADVKISLRNNDNEFDLVFIDPPYSEDYSAIIKNLILKGWITKNSLIVIESPVNKDLEVELNYLEIIDSRKYGISRFIFSKMK